MTTLLLKTPAKVAQRSAAPTKSSPPRKVDGVVIGRFVGFDESRRPMVQLDGILRGVLAARTTIPLQVDQAGREVAVVCELGDPARPIVIGLMSEEFRRPGDSTRRDRHSDLELDLSAERQITLRCGKASITLTRAGKIIVRGTYVLSRSSGVNKIKGASIQLN